jgi:hypothetical protein
LSSKIFLPELGSKLVQQFYAEVVWNSASEHDRASPLTVISMTTQIAWIPIFALAILKLMAMFKTRITLLLIEIRVRLFTLGWEVRVRFPTLGAFVSLFSE